MWTRSLLAMLDDLDWDKLDKRIWTTKDGRDIPLAEIDDKHLANLIVWCDKRILHFENKFITIRRESLLDAIDAFGGDLEKYNRG